MFDVVALVELLIDFTANGSSEQGNGLFEANPGGAPCNVLSMLTRLGRHTAFVGKVGEDIFGRLLKATIEEVGIDSAGLVLDASANSAFTGTRAQTSCCAPRSCRSKCLDRPAFSTLAPCR